MKDEHFLDDAGNPAGGIAEGEGFSIDWSKTTPELVLEAVANRLRFWMDHPVGDNPHTPRMVRHIGVIKEAAQRRRADREARGVRGTFAK